MTIGITYIGVGDYSRLWDEFYTSCEKFFLPDYEKTYYLFTDDQRVIDSTASNVKPIFEPNTGWPRIALDRFRIISSVRDDLVKKDYSFFMNGNYQFVDTVFPEDVLPDQQQALVVMSWHVYKSKPVDQYPYERNNRSNAYIPYGEGRSYFQGGFIGGRSSAFIELIETCLLWEKEDSSHNIIPIVYDESYVNKYMLDKSPRIVGTGFGKPEEWTIDEPVKAVLRDKKKLFGEEYMFQLKAPLLSVIVPAYNVSEYIIECIDSILDNDYRNTEVIVVDDGSTDETSLCLSKYQENPRVRLIHKKNGGLSSARNAGLEVASGEYITFVDGDDAVSKDSFLANMKYFQDESISVVQYPLLFDWTGANERLHLSTEKEIKDERVVLKLFLRGKITFSVCDKIFRMSSLRDFRFPQGKYHEDMIFWNEFLDIHPTFYLSTTGKYYYRYRESSIVRTAISFDRAVDYLEAFNELYRRSSSFKSLLFDRIFAYSSMLYEVNNWNIGSLPAEENRLIKNKMKLQTPGRLSILAAFLSGKVGSKRKKSINIWRKILNHE